MFRFFLKGWIKHNTEPPIFFVKHVEDWILTSLLHFGVQFSSCSCAAYEVQQPRKRGCIVVQ